MDKINIKEIPDEFKAGLACSNCKKFDCKCFDHLKKEGWNFSGGNSQDHRNLIALRRYCSYLLGKLKDEEI